MNIIECMGDRALFGSMFADPSWKPWRAFLSTLFALPMDEDQLALYRHHTARTELPEAQFREAALVIGRRGGKSRVLALIATFLAVMRDYRAYVVPGESPVVAVIAADRRQAKIILRYIVGFLQSVPLLAPLIADELAETVTLTNGVVIEVHTGRIGAPRGRTFIAVLADEIAFWPADEGSANPDQEVVNAVRPGLATIPNSIMLLASSPYAKRGVLWNTFKRHYGRDGSRTLVWKATSAEMNPDLDPAIIEAAMEDDPASARSEYLAEFRDDVGIFVSREVVAACVEDGCFERAPVPNRHYAGFADPSGGSSDSMTLAIAHLDGEVAMLDAVREVQPPFSPESVVHEFSQTLKHYGIGTVYGDRYAGLWPTERFLVHGITYLTADRPKSDLYRDLLPLLNSGQAGLLDNARMVNQFCSLERRTARGGRDSIDHPPGQHHDDLANAVAGALLHAKVRPPQAARYVDAGRWMAR